MKSVHELKTGTVVDTPVLLFECTLLSGTVERWSTHAITSGGNAFSARVLQHNLLEFSSSSNESIDAVSRVSLTLANADSHFSQINRSVGLKGGKLTVQFVFADLSTGNATSEPVTLFRGVCDPPEEITEAAIRLSFNSRMSLQRIAVPEVRVQRRCPWVFPSTPEQRQEAVDGGNRGRYSPFFRCGYSPDQDGGCGNNNDNSGPFTSCDYSRASCVERGMFDHDSSGRETRRFGGVEFVPSTITVRSYGESGSHTSAAIENESRYNDVVPLIYGIAWYRPPVTFARNDGNLTHTEVLLSMGEIDSVVKVLANGIELPSGKDAPQATATGWYNLVSNGARNGAFNQDFRDSAGNAVGDPCGSMAVLSVVVPNRISDGSSLPKIDVLIRGQILSVVDDSGEPAGRVFTNNPAWVLLDLLRRTGWQESEIDLVTFAQVAAYCDERLQTADLNGSSRDIARFACNLVLRNRRSAADVVRGVRNSSGLYLTYGSGGLLQLHAESSLAVQQTDKPESSNSTEVLADGWPAYEFGDGSSSFSDILRKPSGEPALRLYCRSTADSPNRYTLEFQDEFNEYQQDSLSLVDLDDATSTGHEVSANFPALGVPNYNQASRILRLALDRSIRGNLLVEFESGLRAIGLKPGDIITLTYEKEGLDRQTFRILSIRPRLNYRTALITAQLHDDTWYVGESGLAGGGRQPAVGGGVPLPLAGTTLTSDGETQFGVAESYRERADHTWDVDLSVSFSVPPKPSVLTASVPLIDLAATTASTGGSLLGGRSYYYAISAVDSNGSESPLSFVVRAAVPSATDTNLVRLQHLSFASGTASFRVYRGLTPSRMLRIASDQAVADTFTDSGATVTPAAPPDVNFHHANFYWRMESLPEAAADIFTANTIGRTSLGLLPDAHRGKIVRIWAGTGAGQERPIASNTDTTITTSTSWTVVPDATSTFVIADSGWNFGAMSDTSPLTFTVPNRQDAVVQISGRSSSVDERECAYELSPLTRHVIGGAGDDLDVPDAPIFGLATAGRGSIEVSSVGFENLENTRGISAGTLMLHCWDELKGIPSLRLAADITDSATSIVLASPVEWTDGVLVQIGSEVLVAYSIAEDRVTCQVQRGAYDTNAAAHTSDEPVLGLTRRISILPFVKGLFGTPAGADYSQSIAMPNQRIIVAEMFVTNAKGSSQVSSQSYTNTVDEGLRTLSGGQFTLQVAGMLAIQSSAVPPCSVDQTRSVRDVFASVTDAPDGAPIAVRVTAGSQALCDLTIPAGQTTSNVISGVNLPPLVAGTNLGLDIISTGVAGIGRPGAGLTVTIRL